MVKTLLLPIHGAWVQSLVRELRSYIPHGKKKKKTKKKQKTGAGERKEGKEKQEENRKGEVSDD